MKTFLILLSTLLFTLIVIGGVIVFGPFRDVLPQNTRAVVDATFPDYFQANGRPPTTQGTSDPYGELPATAPVPTETLWRLPGQNDGTSIVVEPFTDAGATTSGTLGSDPPTHNVLLITQEQGVPYSIQYFSNDQSFMVSLFGEPLGETRAAAEKMFLRTLGISEGEACYLRYAVVAPYWVNSFYADKNLGFSFCPGATAL